MSYEMLFFLVAQFQNVANIIYFNFFYKPRFNKYISSILVFLLLMGLYLITIPIMNLKVIKLFIVILVQVIGFKILSRNTFIECLKKTLMFVFLALLAELITDLSFMLISASYNTRTILDDASIFDTLRIISGCACCTFANSFVFIYATLRKKILKNISFKLILTLILFPISYLFIDYIVYGYNISTFSISTLFFLFISSVLNVFICYIVTRLIMDAVKYKDNEKKLELLKRKQELNLEYYNVIKEKEEVIRKINHDIKNNLQVVNSLKSDKEKNKIIDKINKDLDKYQTIKYSKYDILNIILSLKKDEAIKKNVKFNINFKNDINYMEEIDISNLFSNILDNAIENASYSKKRTITITIANKMKNIVIECINSYDGNLIINNNELTSRKEGEEHGYGIKIVKDIVKKYNGEVVIKHTENKFILSILIPEKQN